MRKKTKMSDESRSKIYHEKQHSSSYVSPLLYFEQLVPFWIILLASHERQRLSPATFCDYQTIEVFAIFWYSSLSNKSPQSPKTTSI